MMKALFKPRGRHAERLPDLPELAHEPVTEMLPLPAPVLVLDDTQAWPAPEPSPPLPKRVPFRERCQPAFRPDVSATIRADLRDLPAFRATVRTAGLAGLHMRAPAGPRTERKLP